MKIIIHTEPYVESEISTFGTGFEIWLKDVHPPEDFWGEFGTGSDMVGQVKTCWREE